MLRLTIDKINFIKKTIYDKIDSEIYIFGSRLDDEAKGEDIDIYIIPKETLDTTTKQKLKFELIDILEEELFIPVDIIISKDKNRQIEQIALQGQKIG